MANKKSKSKSLDGLMSLSKKFKGSKIMRFNELVNNDSFDVMNDLYDLNNGEINGLVNDLAKTHDYSLKKEIVEDILLSLDDIKEITPEKFNQFEDGLKKYISEQ